MLGMRIIHNKTNSIHLVYDIQNSEPKLAFVHASTELLITNQSNGHNAYQQKHHNEFAFQMKIDK